MENYRNSKNNYNYSYHSKTRMSQRGISSEAIRACIHHGDVIHKQGMKFFFIPKKQMDLIPYKLQGKIKDLIVVTNSEVDCVITCYRNANAPHRIKKKPKRLATYL